MNLYFWLLLTVSALILIVGAIRGGRRGFVAEAEGLAAGACATAALVLVGSLATGSLGERFSSKALAVALLIVLAVFYSLCRIIFMSLRIFAGLPVIRWLDGLLGIAAGAVKAYLILYIAFYLLKIWLNL